MGYVVRHSTSNINKARRKGNVALGVSSNGYDKTSVSGFYAGVEPVEGKHNLVRTSTSGDPDFYALTDTELVNLANQLGGSVSTTLEAQNYLIQQDNIIFLDELPNDVVTDSLEVELNSRIEASFLDNKPITNLVSTLDYAGLYGVTHFEQLGDDHYRLKVFSSNDGLWYSMGVQSGYWVMSYEYRAIQGDPYLGGHVDGTYVSFHVDGVEASSNQNVGDLRSTANDGEWHKIHRVVANTNSTRNGGIFIQITRGGAASYPAIAEIRNVQIEPGTEPTPYAGPSTTRTQTRTWYDISGNGNDTTLVNGPTFTSNKTLQFDGVNDYAIIGGANNSHAWTADGTVGSDTFTHEIWSKGTDTTGLIISKPWNGSGRYNISLAHSYFQLKVGTGVSQGPDESNSISFDSIRDDKWHQTVIWANDTQMGYYIDGGKKSGYKNHGLTGGISDYGNSQLPLGLSTLYFYGGTNDGWSGNTGHANEAEISIFKKYSKVLSADEVRQNYYGGDIATDGLNWSLDAGNLVSYESGSTTAYSLTGSVYSGSLTNGVAYSNYDGGVWEFDGSDDYISIPTYTFGNGNWTLSMWINADSFANYNLMSNSSGGPVSNVFGAYGSTPKIFYYNYDGAWKSHYGNTTLSTGKWYMLTWVNYQGASSSDGTMQMYVNGRLDSSLFNSYTTNGGPCNVIGKRYSGTSFDGKIGNVFVYTKALSDSEVLQNYNAHKTRFL